MELAKTVCTVEQSKRLRALGIKGEAIFQSGDSDVPQMGPMKFNRWGVAELGVMLPGSALHPCHTMPGGKKGDGSGAATGVWQTGDEYNPWATRPLMEFDITFCQSEAEARAAMLITLLESGKVTAKEVNARLATV